MWSSRGVLVLAALAVCCAGGCSDDEGDDPQPGVTRCDASSDCSPQPDSGSPAGTCRSDGDCADGDFCNGDERCDPDHRSANGHGCVDASSARTCEDDGLACTTARCDTSENRCVHEAADGDGDGHRDAACIDAEDEPLGDDCDDEDADRFVGNAEDCDDHDEDCNPQTFGTDDADGDGSIDQACRNTDTEGVLHRGLDCDDTDLAVHAKQPEFCDGLDNDCDGLSDEVKNAVAWFADSDGDGFGAGDPLVVSCTPQPGLSLLGNDCNDDEAGRSPRAVETCNGNDDNCNGVSDEGLSACDSAPPLTDPLPINECANGIDNCTGAALCVDTPPSFRCECPSGYEASGKTACADIDECTGPTVCTANYPCRNLAPHYTCRGQFPDWPQTAPELEVSLGVVNDGRSGLAWQQGVDAGSYTWMQAKTYCAGLSLAGSGWRLPTKAELESIVDDTHHTPASDPIAFPNTPATQFWTASPDFSSADFVWIVSFDVGGSYTIDTTVTTARVRCVRGGGNVTAATGSGGAPPGRYATAGDGTVQDTRTQLTWLQAVSPETLGQSAASSYCTGLQIAGGGFRLPTRAELASLVNAARAIPAIDPLAFPSAPSEWYWSSSTYLGTASTGWGVNFYHGNVDVADVSSLGRARCVR